MKTIQGISRHQLQFTSLYELNLLSKKTIAVDGSKFRAVNSRKNNYNQKKIDKHQAMINEKAYNYLKELEELDSDETGATSTNDGKALHRAAAKAKENMNLKKRIPLMCFRIKVIIPDGWL